MAGNMRPDWINVSGVSALVMLTLVPAHAAEPYPVKPIRVIIPFSPGGTSDTLARLLGQKMTESWGQQIVVDSRPGASGIIGTEIAMRAPADEIGRASCRKECRSRWSPCHQKKKKREVRN